MLTDGRLGFLARSAPMRDRASEPTHSLRSGKMMKSMLFAVTMTLSLVVSSAEASSAAKFGQSTVSDPLSQSCTCAVYFMGQWWCTPCG
jgi:hypothetical protein